MASTCTATVVGALLRGIVKKIDAELLERLRAEPEAEFRLIVKTEGQPGQYLARLQALGIAVRRKFRLTRSLAITARADTALQLADEAWVEKIEEDQIVRTM
jgi:hypothetical protein